MRATARLLGEQRASWACAMQAEVEAVGDEREALALAAGWAWQQISRPWAPRQ